MTEEKKSTADELKDLIKPIAVHEAKSAIYKAKLAGFVLQKGAIATGKAASFVSKKTSELIESHKDKRSKK